MDKPRSEEENLLEKIAGGSESALEQFVGIYQQRILNLIYRYTRSRQDAEELAQDVFVKVWDNARSFRGRSRVSTWLHRIAVNLAINHLKKKRIPATSLDRPVTFQGRDAPRQVAAPESRQPDSILEEKTLRAIMEDATGKLPPAQRMALVLSKYEKYSYAEIAETMKTSVPAVESLLFRAKQNLKKYLGK